MGYKPKKGISPVVVTFISMGIGATSLLIIGVTIKGIPSISPENWLFLVWLAIINTAFAFTLKNYTLRTLAAMESSIINGTMMIQISILAWYFIDEKITLQEGIGMVMAAIGVFLVQIKINNIKISGLMTNQLDVQCQCLNLYFLINVWLN